jgi:hypothetical protein
MLPPLARTCSRSITIRPPRDLRRSTCVQYRRGRVSRRFFRRRGCADWSSSPLSADASQFKDHLSCPQRTGTKPSSAQPSNPPELNWRPRERGPRDQRQYQPVLVGPDERGQPQEIVIGGCQSCAQTTPAKTPRSPAQPDSFEAVRARSGCRPKPRRSGAGCRGVSKWQTRQACRARHGSPGRPPPGQTRVRCVRLGGLATVLGHMSPTGKLPSGRSNRTARVAAGSGNHQARVAQNLDQRLRADGKLSHAPGAA